MESFSARRSLSKPTRCIFYGFCVYFTFKRWVERQAKMALCAQEQDPAKLGEEGPFLTSENPWINLLVLTP